MRDRSHLIGRWLTRYGIGSRRCLCNTCILILFTFLWRRLLFLRLFSGAASSINAALNKLIEAIPFVLPQVERVILHVSIDVSFLDIFFLQEAGDLSSARILCGLLIVLGKVCLPVGVNKVVTQGLEGLNFAFGPLIEID